MGKFQKCPVLSFNPMFCNYGRLEDVVEEASTYSVIALQGAGQKIEDDIEIESELNECLSIVKCKTDDMVDCWGAPQLL